MEYGLQLGKVGVYGCKCVPTQRIQGNQPWFLDFENWDVIFSYVYGLKHFLNHGPLWESNESNGLHSQKNACKHIHKALCIINLITLKMLFFLLKNYKKKLSFSFFFNFWTLFYLFFYTMSTTVPGGKSRCSKVFSSWIWIWNIIKELGMFGLEKRSLREIRTSLLKCASDS